MAEFSELSGSDVLYPDAERISRVIDEGLLVLDTNVLLGFYRRPEKAARAALDLVESVQDRVWIPHQSAREFWRARPEAIRQLETLLTVVDQAHAGVRQSFNEIGRRRAGYLGYDINQAKADFLKSLIELKDTFVGTFGGFVEWQEVVRNDGADWVSSRLSVILKDRVGDSLDDERQMVNLGRERFEAKIPPGYGDADSKRVQPIERGTGDFLIWEQILRYSEANREHSKVVLVTDDIKKEDWVDRYGGSKEKHAAKPALVYEARDRAGCEFYVISSEQLFQHLAESQIDKPDAVVVEDADLLLQVQTSWSEESYRRLLDYLQASGSYGQRDVIRAAARAGGFIDREGIFAITGREENRSLRRFKMPAARAVSQLIQSGEIDDSLPEPLTAEYDGPGQAIGYSVPDEFAGYETAGSWLEAARQAALTDPERPWSISELVGVIRDHRLRDLTQARTPEQTLSTELRYRQPDPVIFERGEGQTWILMTVR